jgi:capsular exopolysaccharide synthesis family protein
VNAEHPPGGGQHWLRSSADNYQIIDVDIGQVLRILWTRKWIFFLTLAMILAAGSFLILTQPPTFTASAELLIEPEQPIVDIRSLTSPTDTTPQGIASQLEIVRARSVVDQVADAVGYPAYLEAERDRREASLAGLPARLLDGLQVAVGSFAPALAAEPRKPLSRDDVIRAFYKALNVERLPGSNVLSVQFEATDPAYAATVANTLAAAYIDNQREAKAGARARVTQLLGGRLEAIRARIQASVAATEAYREEAGLNRSAGTDLLAELLSKQMGQLASARAESAAAEARLREIEALRTANARDQLIELLNSAAIADIRLNILDLERQIARKSKELGANHPDFIELRSALATARGRLDNEINTAIANLRMEANVKAQRVTEVEQATTSVREEMASLNPKEYRLKQLEAETEVNRELHDKMLSRIREAEEAAFETPDARILSRAQVPTIPSSPPKPLLLAALLAGGSLLSAGIAFAREFLSGGIRNEDALAGLGLPVLAVVPRVPQARRERAFDFPRAGRPYYRPAYAEAFHSLHTNLELIGGRPQKGRAMIYMVTSAVSGEGKSTVVRGLARLAAQVGHRVLVIDCDLRQPRMHQEFALDNRVGLSTCSPDRDDVSRQTLVRVGNVNGVDVITAGPVRPGPHRLLRTSLLPEILETYRPFYDLILIDSAPVLAVADPVLVGQHCDAAVIVVKWSSTARRVAMRAIDRMVSGGVPLAGSVLTQVAPSMHRGEHYGYLAYS